MPLVSRIGPASGPAGAGQPAAAGPSPATSQPADVWGGPATGAAPSAATSAVGSTTSFIAAHGWVPASALPSEVGLGAVTIDRYTDPRVVGSDITVTVFTPMPTESFPGQVLDLNAKAAASLLPHRAIVGDAGHTRAFVGIDKRQGSALDAALGKIEAKIPVGPDGQRDLDTVAEWLRANINKVLAWAPGSTFNDGRPGLPWDKKISVPGSIWGAFGQVGNEPVGHAPRSTGVGFPVVPLERYLEIGQGYCIHKALVAALILERLGFGCRIVNGAVAKAPGLTTGHTWLELTDGRILDVAWSRCEARRPDKDPMFPRRFKLGSSWRFENLTYPYVGWPT